MTTIDKLQALHTKVWTFRADVADVWPTPDTLDSLRFAFTEAGEAMDAYLRTKGGYARNNVKEPDLFGELADCALMLLTALGPEYIFSGVAWKYSRSIDETCEAVIGAWSWSHAPFGADENHNWKRATESAVSMIAVYPGMDLAAELDKRMTRIRAKHGKEAV